MNELVIKVPAPFCGVEDVGFSARYPEQRSGEPLRDVPVFVEGAAPPMRLLVERLSLFPERTRLVEVAGDDEAYSWTQPIQLSDELCVIAFRDRSLVQHGDAHSAARSYFLNLLRPLAFPFLRDCVRIGRLRLAESITVVIEAGRMPAVDLHVDRRAITAENGELLLA